MTIGDPKDKEYSRAVGVPVSDEWSEEWPTEPGLYLFYGDRFKKADNPLFKPDFFLCKVRAASNAMMYIAGDNFMYESQGYGVFKPITEPVPEIPRKSIK